LPLVDASEHQMVYGFIEYSDGSWVPNDVIVTITNDTGELTTVATLTAISGHTGLYGLDVYDIGGDDGHTINVSVSYGGCTGYNLVIVDTSQGPSIKNNVTISGNLPPVAPSQPSGNTSGDHGNSFTYSTSTTDSDGDDVYYWFDWGDNTNSGWVGPYSSGSTGSASHSWDAPGNFTVKTKAKDEHGAERGAGWSDSITVTMLNNAPNESITPTGLTSAYSVVRYTYLTNATDPDGDNLYYLFDWGDNTSSSWVGPYSSGSTGSASHIWTTAGTYQIKSKVKDEFDLETDAGWSDPLNVTILSGPAENQKPSVSFTYAPTNPVANTTTIFNDSSVDYDGSIINWTWNFGDGNVNYTQNSTYIYNQSGSYVVNLTVTDNQNATNSTESTISVSSTPSPNISWEETKEITLVYNENNKGSNYLVWRGEAINASELAEGLSLIKGESISIFSKTSGMWQTYVVGTSDSADDFYVLPLDVINIHCLSTKTISVDVLQEDTKLLSITINFVSDPETQTSNDGYNFFPWATNQITSIKDFIETYGLSDENIEISK